MVVIQGLRTHSQAISTSEKPQRLNKRFTKVTRDAKEDYTKDPEKVNGSSDTRILSGKLRKPPRKKLKLDSILEFQGNRTVQHDSRRSSRKTCRPDFLPGPTTKQLRRAPSSFSLPAHSKETVGFSPPRTEKIESMTATKSSLDQAYDHIISIDSRFKTLIQKFPCSIFSAEGLAEEMEPFQSLCRGIISQQVSTAAANSIKNKFVELFHLHRMEESSQADNKFPEPAEVIACDVSFLRQAGLSKRKAEYIRGLAKKFVNGELSAAMLTKASDEEVMEMLTAVRGLGKWSVEMFSCFTLKRMDVISTGDLGLQYRIT